MKKRLNYKIIRIILFIVIIFLYVILFKKSNIKKILIKEAKLSRSITKPTILDLMYEPLNKAYNYENTIIDTPIKDNFIDIKINKPIVYIYNTHQTEEYDSDNLSYSIKPTVLYASYIMKDYLNDLGIESVVETSSVKEFLNNNNLNYNGCYEATRYFINSALNKYDSLEYFIDIHRDSVSLNSTLYTNNSKKYAKVLFVVALKHNNSNYNLDFVNEINDMLESKYNGISRGIMQRKDVIFNQDISTKSILLELGGVDNTLEEINNTLEVISNVLYEYMENTNGRN